MMKEPRKGEVMRIAVPDFVSSSFISLIAAKELGFFKSEGLEVEIVHIPALGGFEALRDGAVDLSGNPRWRVLSAVHLDGGH